MNARAYRCSAMAVVGTRDADGSTAVVIIERILGVRSVPDPVDADERAVTVSGAPAAAG
jgi:hypothetical protein